MSNGSIVVLWLVLGAAGLFGVVIFFGLKFRAASMEAGLETRAADLWVPFEGTGFEFGSLVYGVNQDFSALETGMLVRDSRDEQIGRIAFHTGRRTGWVTIQAGDRSFEADVLPTFSVQTVRLHPAGNASEVTCTFSSSFWGTFRFDVPGVGALASKPVRRWQRTPTFAYSLDGRTIGVSRHIGGVVNRGRLLILQGDIFMPVRLFILAMQAQRQ